MIDEGLAEEITRRCKQSGADEAAVDVEQNVVVVRFCNLTRPDGQRGSIRAEVKITPALANDMNECVKYVMLKANEKREYILKNCKEQA